jgi:hypothetical protein
MSKPETVLITGASSGIGLELARCFAADKSNLILVARNREALEKLAEELRREQGIQVTVFTADLARSEAPQEIFEQAGRAGLTVDVLVNNAGFGLYGSFGELPVKRQIEMLQVNIAALVELTGLFLPGMLARRAGGILNVGSVAGFVPGPNMAVYFATKAFVLSFSEALFEELRGTGVSVTDLCPGATETNFFVVARSHRTRMASMPKMSASAVAVAGHRAFRAGKCLCVPGIGNQILSKGARWLPRSVVRRGAARYNKLK